VGIDVDLIAFDADDTLWHTEHLYASAQEAFYSVLLPYHPREWVKERLYETEIENLKHYGYGIKAFALSMIETAVELSEGRVSGAELRPLLERAKAMLNSPVELLEGVTETLARLAAKYPLLMITKGDSFEQGGKIQRSGIAHFFRAAEIVSDKNAAEYRRLFEKHGLSPDRLLMVGNSLRSDILPVLELGGSAVYIPYHTTWLHEVADPPPAGQKGFYQLERIGQLVELLEI
jgi:putative hydrolase of the HAD superfamily